mmetsp:Transcript_95293/g.226957  ORF Transcript_95293/g.226957 Transcript_95293/m.226957 type:complete len:206 (+) Transcript_95293:317-934(+)
MTSPPRIAAAPSMSACMWNGRTTWITSCRTGDSCLLHLWLPKPAFAVAHPAAVTCWHWQNPLERPSSWSTWRRTAVVAPSTLSPAPTTCQCRKRHALTARWKSSSASSLMHRQEGLKAAARSMKLSWQLTYPSTLLPRLCTVATACCLRTALRNFAIWSYCRLCTQSISPALRLSTVPPSSEILTAHQLSERQCCAVGSWRGSSS